MWTQLLIALALMFVIEGVVLAVLPQMTKKAMKEIANLSANSIRNSGVVSMLIGLAIILISK